MPPRLELRFGAAPWLQFVQRMAWLLAAFGLLISPAALAWKTASLAALACAWAIGERQAGRKSLNCRLVLHRDGRLALREGGEDRHGMADGVAWVSRWFCVLRWTDHGSARRHTLVCASENHPDDYRRLLAWLRLGAFGDAEVSL